MTHVSIPLRWSDLDAQGHVNNARIADYLQDARVELFSGTGLLEGGVVVVGQQVQYRRAVEYREEPIDVELGVTGLGGARIGIGYVLRQGGEVVAEARTALTGFDFDEQRVVRIPAGLRAELERYRVDWEPFSELEAPALDQRGIRTLHRTRWSDLDRYAHINNVLVFEYLQQARIEVSPQWDPSMARTGSADSEYLWLVVRQDVDYVAQLHHQDEPLQVYTAPVRLGRTSITSAAEVHDPDGKLLARGRTVVVCAGRDGKPAELPNRQRLESFLVS